MNIDGQCHCGRVTYQAEIDPRSVFDLSLHGLSDADRIALPGDGDLLGGANPDDGSGPENLRQDGR